MLSVKASHKVEASIRIEESNANLLNRYAHFLGVSADEVVNAGLEYVFAKDKEFQCHLQAHSEESVPLSLRVKKPVAQATKSRQGTVQFDSKKGAAA